MMAHDEIVLVEDIYKTLLYCWSITTSCDLDHDMKMRVYRELESYHKTVGTFSYYPTPYYVLAIIQENIHLLEKFLYSTLPTIKIPTVTHRLFIRRPLTFWTYA